ncbi:M48 family metalloprotease [Nocardioides daeguensis]|uniref:Peptidase M48 domain-containing protein n=1 Tax=Nocardioides daeguensis TaxID=908359 RepID=A0ABP6USU1_9ACTN|nr:M48 family metalloprotease [Nocardioides daeguensis]MBV6728193.1 M48 family metalloprotease [Nocardioides daeguensis]MCR1773003.1 M48 family metalloprotease [Nocardioides daeguensis]
MSGTVAYALLIVVAIAYLGGAVLVVAALAKVMATWSQGWRTRRAAEPVDQALQERAAAAMAAVAERANAAAPATDVVAILGAPTGAADRGVGDGGLAVTRFRAGHTATVVFAQVALTGLSCAAVQSLAAHELAHVIRRARTSAAARYAWVLGYLALVLAGAGLTVTAVVAAPQLAGPAMLATMTAAVAFLALRVAFDRREEIAADLFAVDLMRDLDAAAELMRFYEDNVVRQLPEGVLGRVWARLERRWFASHPEPRARLAAMQRHLASEATDR